MRFFNRKPRKTTIQLEKELSMARSKEAEFQKRRKINQEIAMIKFARRREGIERLKQGVGKVRAGFSNVSQIAKDLNKKTQTRQPRKVDISSTLFE